MSGGVDSSVVAVLLKEKGYDVTGITMQLYPQSRYRSSESHIQRMNRNIEDARAMAEKLHIPHHVLDMGEEFHREVIEYFVGEYSSGRTPNPCIRCNRLLKFGFLLHRAGTFGAEYLATGHYARIDKNGLSGTYSLKTGTDISKDQSYFLHTLTQEQLGHVLMPLGTFRKGEVREIARRHGLDIHEKPESQEICFIEAKNYRSFFEQHKPELLSPGPILDGSGKVLGTHSGIVNYTIGQRRGLGIHSHEPHYVTRIDFASNTIYVGLRNDVYHYGLYAENVNWISGKTPDKPLHVRVKIRSIHTPAEGVLFPEKIGRIRVRFNEAQWAVTPGQSAVFYVDDTVLGGGTIVEGVS